MQDGEVVYVTMTGSKRKLAVTKQNSSTLGEMVALPFNAKQVTVVATTRPADGPLNRLAFVTARPGRGKLNHVVSTLEGSAGGREHGRASNAVLGKVYHIARAQNYDADVVERLYWHFKTPVSRGKRAKPGSSSSSSGGCGAFLEMQQKQGCLCVFVSLGSVFRR